LQFAEKEAELKRLKTQITEENKADLETDLELLTNKKEVAVAEAELNAMYDEVEASKSRSDRSRLSVISAERTKQYVMEQAALRDPIKVERDQERYALSRNLQISDI